MPRCLIPAVALVAVFGGFAGYRWAPWRESPRQAWDAISAAAGLPPPATPRVRSGRPE